MAMSAQKDGSNNIRNRRNERPVGNCATAKIAWNIRFVGLNRILVPKRNEFINNNSIINFVSNFMFNVQVNK